MSQPFFSYVDRWGAIPTPHWRKRVMHYHVKSHHRSVHWVRLCSGKAERPKDARCLGKGLCKWCVKLLKERGRP